MSGFWARAAANQASTSRRPNAKNSPTSHFPPLLPSFVRMAHSGSCLPNSVQCFFNVDRCIDCRPLLQFQLEQSNPMTNSIPHPHALKSLHIISLGEVFVSFLQGDCHSVDSRSKSF